MAIQDHKWYTTQTDPCWYNIRDLAYRNEPFNDPKSLTYWNLLGFSNNKYTGDMYDMRNAEPEWMSDVLVQFDMWEHVGWSVYRMGPGTCLPLHSDTYTRFREIHDLESTDSVARAIVFLEDWQSGHYFEIDRYPFVNWSAGDTVVWYDDVPHIASNMGFTDRYTLQITGKI